MESEKQYAMFIHLSQLAGSIVVGLGWILPLVLWLTKKDSSEYIDANGKIVRQGNQPNAQNAEKRGGNVIEIRRLLLSQPIQKGHDDAVNRRQKRIFARSGKLNADGLHAVSQKEQSAHQRTPPEIAQVEFFSSSGSIPAPAVQTRWKTAMPKAGWAGMHPRCF